MVRAGLRAAQRRPAARDTPQQPHRYQAPPACTVSASQSDHSPAPPSPVPMITRPRQLPEAVQACARRDGRVGKLGYHDIRARLARNLGGEPNRVAACCYLLSERILWGGYR